MERSDRLPRPPIQSNGVESSVAAGGRSRAPVAPNVPQGTQERKKRNGVSSNAGSGSSNQKDANTAKGPDVFEFAFAAMRRTILSLHASPSATSLSDSSVQLFPRLEQDLSDLVTSGLAKQAKAETEQTKRRFDLAVKAAAVRVEAIRLARAQVSSSTAHAIQRVKLHQQASQNRLNSLRQMSHTRLRDLSMEVLGEYSKNILRAHRREEYLVIAARRSVVLSTWKRNWERFCLRLLWDICSQRSDILEKVRSRGVSLRLMDGKKMSESGELSHVMRRLTRKVGLVSEDGWYVVSVVKIQKPNTFRVVEESSMNGMGVVAGKKGGNNPPSTANMLFAESADQFFPFLDELQGWMGLTSPPPLRSNSQDTGSSRRPSSRPSSHATSRRTKVLAPQRVLPRVGDFLRNESIAYLQPTSSLPRFWDLLSEVYFNLKGNTLRTGAFELPEQSEIGSSEEMKFLEFTRRFHAQHHSSLYDNRVYICLEERALLQAAGHLNMKPPSMNEEDEEETTDLTVYSSVLMLLQEIYQLPNEIGDLGGRSSAKTLRFVRDLITCHPLRFERSERLHRSSSIATNLTSLGGRVDRELGMRISSELEKWPDVLTARSMLNGVSLHFVPATLMSLRETLAVSPVDGSSSSPTLFVAALCPGLLTSALRSEVPHTVSDSNSLVSQLVIAANDSPAQVSRTQSPDSPKSSSPKSPNSGNIDRSTIVMMQPLEGTVVSCLREYYDTLITASLRSNDGEISNNVTESVMRKQRLSCVNVIPDHARRHRREQRYATSNPSFLPSSTNEPHHLRHLYGLFSDENAYEVDPSDPAAANISVGPGQRLVRHSYYLVQLLPQTILAARQVPQDILPVGLASDSLRSALDDEQPAVTSVPLSARGNFADEWETRLENDEALLERCILSEHLSVMDMESLLITPQPIGTNSRAMQVTGTSSGAVSPPKPSKKSWDASILSNFCHWRSCLCSVNLNGRQSILSEQSLCRYHTELRYFLDSTVSRNGSAPESTKYLPRKAPDFAKSIVGVPDSKRDMITIRAASTLLQELWDGRLKSTVSLFTRRMVTDLRLRAYLQSQFPLFAKYHSRAVQRRGRLSPCLRLYRYNTTGAGEDEVISQWLPAPPTWSIWKNTEHMDRSKEYQSRGLVALKKILSAERQVSEEIAIFTQLQVFPSQELALIRRDLKSFREQQEEILMSSLDTTDEGKDERNSSAKGKSRKEGQDLSAIHEGYEKLIMILDEEQALCDRKFSIMVSRRQAEEDGRNAAMRKAAKLKAMEAAQSRDPNNFRNQGLRF